MDYLLVYLLDSSMWDHVGWWLDAFLFRFWTMFANNRLLVISVSVEIWDDAVLPRCDRVVAT